MESAPPTQPRPEPTTAARPALPILLALEPARHASWASVWVLGLGMGALFPWLLSMGNGAHNAWPAAPMGHVLLATACILPVGVRIVTIRLGLEPTADERFSWHDVPARRAAYEAQVASRRPTWLRLLAYAPWVLGLIGWILYKAGI